MNNKKETNMTNKNTESSLSAVLEATDKNKGGRPTKYEPETVERLLTALADGLNIKQACVAAQVSETTLGRWRDEHPELEPQLNEAREQARQEALRRIRQAGERGDWKADVAFLQYSFAADYRQAGTKIDISATATGQQANVVCTEAERKRLIEQRERLLAGSTTPL
jgi:hypothetical protein